MSCTPSNQHSSAVGVCTKIWEGLDQIYSCLHDVVLSVVGAHTKGEVIYAVSDPEMWMLKCHYAYGS